MTRRALAGAAILLAAAGVSLLAAASVGRAAGPVRISGAWARATAPSQDVGVVYLSLTSPDGDVLTGVSSADATGAMLHETTARDGITGMAPMASLPLPAGQTVTLQPHGRHVMLMGLRHPLVAGGHVGIDLHLAHAGSVHAEVPVLPIGAEVPVLPIGAAGP